LLEERGVEDPIEPAPRLLLPILEGATEVNSDDIRELWARLLAASMDASRAPGVRIAFIETLKKLEPLDARVLQKRGSFAGDLAPYPTKNLSQSLQQPEDEIQVSLDNLVDLNLMVRGNGPSGYQLTSFGRRFLAAVS
jgi:hypothetical protein